jgi:hypothetical protein
MLTKTQTIIQGTYLFLFIFSTIGIIRNIELDVPIPTFWIIVFGISTFLTLGKFIYWFKKGEL